MQECFSREAALISKTKISIVPCQRATIRWPCVLFGWKGWYEIRSPLKQLSDIFPAIVTCDRTRHSTKPHDKINVESPDTIGILSIRNCACSASSHTIEAPSYERTRSHFSRFHRFHVAPFVQQTDIHSIIKVSVTSLAECYQIEAVNMEKLLTMPSATLVLESWSCHPPITPSEQVNTRFKVKGASISRMTTSLS